MNTKTRRLIATAILNLGLFAIGPQLCRAQSSAPTPETARVYIYRNKHFTGMALSPSVFCDGKPVGRMENGSYFMIDLPSGAHSFHSNGKQKDFVLNLQPGQQYYLQVKIASGLAKGHGQIYGVDPETAKEEIKRLLAKTANDVGEPAVAKNAQ